MSQGQLCLQSPLEKIIKVALETYMLGSVCKPLHSGCPLLAMCNEKSSSRLNVMEQLRVIHFLCVYTCVYLHTIRIPNSCTCEECRVHVCTSMWRPEVNLRYHCSWSLTWACVSGRRAPGKGSACLHFSRATMPSFIYLEGLFSSETFFYHGFRSQTRVLMLAWQGCPCLSLLPSLQLFTSDMSTCMAFTASLCFHVTEAVVPTGKTADGNVDLYCARQGLQV